MLDSKIAGCWIRGINTEVLNHEEEGFKYINCLDRDYDDKIKNIDSVEFDISRFGKYSFVLRFGDNKSEKEAIEAIEEFLSKPLTEDYYNMIVDDLFHNDCLWADAKDDYSCRGECLTDCRFLERTYVKDGRLTFFIGS